MRKLKLSLLPERLSVCRLAPDASVPQWAFAAPFWSITRTQEELSLVVPDELVPQDWKAERGWWAIKVLGPIDWSLTGVLNAVSVPLAQGDVPILAISTYDTDYVLVRDGDLKKARQILASHGHRVSPEI